jgi:hypothetical protein
MFGSIIRLPAPPRFKSHLPSGGLFDTASKIGSLLRHRNTVIFPRGLGQTPPANDSQYPYLYTPDQLLAQLIDAEGKDLAAGICVTFAAYCKQTSSARHEFILVLVKEAVVDSVSNWILIDRNAESQSAGLFSSSSKVRAMDLLRVSYYGDSHTLLRGSSLNSSYCVHETMAFDMESPFPLSTLLYLVDTASSKRTEYELFNSQCYWFASAIWDCMQTMFPEASHLLVKEGRGRLRVYKQKANEPELADIERIVREKVSNLVQVGYHSVLELVIKQSAQLTNYLRVPVMMDCTPYMARVFRKPKKAQHLS